MLSTLVAPFLRGTQRPLQTLIGSHSTPIRDAWMSHCNWYIIIHILIFCQSSFAFFPSALSNGMYLESTRAGQWGPQWEWNLLKGNMKERWELHKLLTVSTSTDPPGKGEVGKTCGPYLLWSQRRSLTQGSNDRQLLPRALNKVLWFQVRLSNSRSDMPCDGEL